MSSLKNRIKLSKQLLKIDKMRKTPEIYGIKEYIHSHL